MKTGNQLLEHMLDGQNEAAKKEARTLFATVEENVEHLNRLKDYCYDQEGLDECMDDINRTIEYLYDDIYFILGDRTDTNMNLLKECHYYVTYFLA